MSIIDFIKNRGAQEQATAPAKSETIHQATARQAEQTKAAPKLQDAMPPEQLAKAAEAKQASITNMQDVTVTSIAPTPTPSGGATSPQALRQMSNEQGNPAPSLSPTSMQKGTPEKDSPSPSPSPTPTPKPTMQRATPSWER